MRLTSLTLERYGNFERQEIPFDPRPGRLNLVVAPNGAGKSVLRRAFGDLLFGIGGQTPMGFRFGYKGMQIRAEGIGPDGAPVRLARRKGQGRTLLDGNGAELAPALLDRLLGGTDLARLERLFALDTERLRAGGMVLLETGGELAEALLSASSGLPRVRDLRGRLEAARDAVAPQRKSAGRPFYRGLDAFVEARKLKRQEALRPEAWQQLVAELVELEKAQAEAGRALPGLSAELARLDRVRMTKPLLVRLDGALEWLGANPGAPVLPPELGARLADAREALHRAADAERGVATRRQVAEQALADIVPDAALLEHAAAIDALAGEAATARQAGGDLPAVRERLAETLHEIRRLLRDLGTPVGRAGAGELLPDAALQARARTLLTRRTTIDGRLDGLPEILAGHAADRAQQTALLDTLPPPADAAGLVALVREIRAEGDPAQLADDAAAEATARRQAAATAFALVPGRDRAGLAALTPDLPARYDRAYEALVEARRDAQTCTTATGAARETVAAIAEEIARLLAGEVPADAAELARARAHRDRGWDLVFRGAFAGEAVSEAEIADWTGGVPLPVAYGRAVAAADAVADRRVLEAAMLDRLAQARLRLAAAEADLVQAEAHEAGARLALSQGEAAWASALVPLGFSAETTASEIREFLLLRAAALAAAEAAALADARERRLAERHAGWSRRLAEALGRAERGAAALPALLHEAEHRIEQARAAETRRGTVVARLDAIARQIAQAGAKQAAGERELAAWRSDWAACLGALRRPAEETPAELQSVLDLLARLREASREADGLEDRVRGMAGRIAEFDARATALASAVAPPLASLAPLDAAERLRALLATARTAATRRAELTRQLHAVLAEQERAVETQREARATTGALVDAIGAADLDAAEARLRLAAERARHAALRDELEAQLLSTGGGQSLDELRAEAAGIAADALEAALDETRARQEQAIARLQATAAEAERRRGEMEQLAAADTTARAAAQGEAALATLGRALEEALVMQAAALLLEQGLAKVEEGGDNRLVARIGDKFRQLTGDTYAGLRVAGEANGARHLVALERAFPDEERRIDDLSDGTRDQLFLALRLVAIEQHVATAPPLPFVADDILQTFDDTRAVAALQALLDLSERTQVIVLSHHPHLLDLAAALPAGRVHVHRLARAAPEPESRAEEAVMALASADATS